MGSMGGLMGLRAEAVEAVLRMNGVKLKDRAATFDDLQLMADAAMEVLNERAENE
jgi:hypothetical protein